jgi:hypothetical protein
MVIENQFQKAANKVATVFQHVSVLCVIFIFISLLIQFTRLFVKRFSLSPHLTLYAEQYGRPELGVTILSVMF